MSTAKNLNVNPKPYETNGGVGEDLKSGGVLKDQVATIGTHLDQQ